MHTEAKPKRTASSQSARIWFVVASGFSSVWSISLAISSARIAISFFGEISFRRQSQNANIFQIAIALIVIQTVADNKFVGNREADVVRFDILNAARRLVEQRGDFQRLRLALLQHAAKIAEREAGIENVLDQNHVQAFDAGIEVLVETHLPRRLLAFAVARDGNEVDGSVEVDFANQIREKNARAFEYADQVDALAAKIAADLARHRDHAFLNRRSSQQNFQMALVTFARRIHARVATPR